MSASRFGHRSVPLFRAVPVVTLLVVTLLVAAAAPAAAQPNRAGELEGTTCATNVTGGHTACIRITSGGSVYGQLTNDSSSKESCGDFRLTLSTYDHTGHRSELAGDVFRKDSCLKPGGMWEAYFPYVDASRTHTGYDGSTGPSYLQMCVKGQRMEAGGYELITGSACR